MTRFLSRTRGWLAAVLVVALLVPVGRWAADEFAFDAAGDAVVEELGSDAALTRALVMVRSVSCGGLTSTGSAFVLDVDGVPTVVTNRHVVDDARSISVRALTGGDLLTVAGHRLAVSADVAVLELGDGDRPPEVLQPGSPVDAGAEIRVVGFPSGRPSTGTGTVVEVAPGRLEVDAPVSGGASGSPVLDGEGRVVGQVHGTTQEGNGVATPIGDVLHAVATSEEASDC